MKKSFVFILFLGWTTGFAQQEKKAESQITDVTVFLSQAQVTREVKSRVDAGKTELVISGLTSQLDPTSVQVSGKGSFTILGIRHKQNYLNEFNVPDKLKLLKDSLENYQKQLTIEQSQKEILNKEEQMLLSNQKIGGTSQNLTVNELKAMADFYRSRLGDVLTSKVKQDEKIKKINNHIVRLQRQINSENELYSRNTSEIVVSVSASAATSASLEVSYIVSNAGWNPVYDLRAMNTKNPVQLAYRANVYQSTGEMWKNVKLKLSTANPNQGGLKPELFPWFLDFYNPVAYEYRKRSLGKAMPAASELNEIVVTADDLERERRSMGFSATKIETTSIQTSLNTEFEIPLPYTVESSSKPTLVDIKNHEMKAIYNYSTVPKLDTDAFLIAKATGWEDFDLLPGEANIFFEGTYVGKTFIDPNNIQDTLSVSLGRDARIVVKREELKDLTTKRTIGSNQREEHVWEISVRNTKGEPVKITVEDQMPISKNSQIEVNPLDTGGSRFDEKTGKMVWSLTLQPNETRKMGFRYEVKYPKDKQVSGL
ncbi:MAG TPA: DUF4139 domain-containing protein [Cyclobacteriaceae bacterium]|nr:DUF4139 domain-containing protein [Cyclobacteriaceae bacterium]